MTDVTSHYMMRRSQITQEANMKNIYIDSMLIKNVKGIREKKIEFKKRLQICGRNATGKTSVFDAFCWAAYDKDSIGRTKFDIRELDSSGEKVHNTEIVSAVNMSVNDVPYEIKKTQKEKWTTKRGEKDTVLTGNVNEYEINGYPKSEKEFKDFIDSIVDEKTFSILTRPTRFPELDWKEQRKILFDIIGDVDDKDIESDYFDLLKPELAIASIDDIKKKYTKSRNELKKKPDELKARIDEVRSQIVETDSSAAKSEKEALLKSISEIEEQMITLNGMNNHAITEKIMNLQLKQRQLLLDANAEREKSILAKKEDFIRLKTTLDVNKRAWDFAEAHKASVENNLTELRAKLESLKANIKAKSAEEPPEFETVCPTCGQALPESKVEQSKQNWRDAVFKRVKELMENQKLGEKRIAEAEKELKKAVSKCEHACSAVEDARKRYQDFEPEYNAVLALPEVTKDDISEIAEINKQIDELEASKVNLMEIDKQKDALKEQLLPLKTKLAEIESQLNSVSENDRRLARIEELENELTNVAQKVADCEKMLYAADCYIRAISKKINDRFDGLEFKLFNVQQNGGVSETCEITIDGVPYSSLNSGHKIIAGLNIIKVLQKYYGVSAPIWIDNAESINADNIPDMDCQMIFLRVTEDPTLTIS